MTFADFAIAAAAAASPKSYAADGVACALAAVVADDDDTGCWGAAAGSSELGADVAYVVAVAGACEAVAGACDGAGAGVVVGRFQLQAVAVEV